MTDQIRFAVLFQWRVEIEVGYVMDKILTWSNDFFSCAFYIIRKKRQTLVFYHCISHQFKSEQ